MRLHGLRDLATGNREGERVVLVECLGAALGRAMVGCHDRAVTVGLRALEFRLERPIASLEELGVEAEDVIDALVLGRERAFTRRTANRVAGVQRSALARASMSPSPKSAR